jgi:hypothetical protein
MGKPSFTNFLASGAIRARGNWKEDITEVNKIALVKRTRGTETSQYPEEKTSTEIPLVVASERGPGQCLIFSYQKLLERSAREGDSPVC